MKKISLLIMLLVNNAFSATYWIAPKANSMGTGSETNPFSSIENALKKYGGGNTYVFKSGNYVGQQITIWPEYSGSPQNPTIIKSQQKYKAVLLGSPTHNIYVVEGSKWVIIDGFESCGARYTGVKSNADYTVIRNCWIHNNMLQGIEAHNTEGTVIENNLVEYNGQHPQFHHGIYASGSSLTIRSNIVRFNSGFGLHLYPAIKNSKVENNLIYENHRWGILAASESGVARNRIINNTIVNNGNGVIVGLGREDVIANNIIVGNTNWKHGKEDPIQVNQGGKLSDAIIDYNLCVPKFSAAGPHGRSIAPSFLDIKKDTFFLKKGSPSIGKGTQKYAPERDFFGRIRPKEKTPDLGCFPYEDDLFQSEIRKQWFYQWPYFFKNKTGQLPDLWQLP